MSCGHISRGSEPDCDNLPVGGTKARLILINWDDVLYILEGNDVAESGSVWDETFDETFGPSVLAGAGLGVITAIVLKPGKQAYEFIGFRNDVKKSEETQKTSHNKKRFIHHCGFVIYEVDQPQKLNIKDIARGRFMAIVESNGEGADSIELLGRDVGLQIDAGQIRSAHETSGVFVINLSTPDNGVEYERKLPQTVGTSYADGQEIIDGLFDPELVGFIMEDESAIFETEPGDEIFIPE